MKPYYRLVNICSGNCLVPSGNKPLPGPILTQIFVAIRHHQAWISWLTQDTVHHVCAFFQWYFNGLLKTIAGVAKCMQVQCIFRRSGSSLLMHLCKKTNTGVAKCVQIQRICNRQVPFAYVLVQIWLLCECSTNISQLLMHWCKREAMQQLVQNISECNTLMQKRHKYIVSAKYM